MTQQPSNTLLAPRFLFQLSVPVARQEPIWSSGGITLDESHRLPDFAELDAGTESEERHLADVRIAWSPAGLAIVLQVEGKQQPLWCRESRLEDSDGLQVWIDTRATHNIHRASRFCHRFVFLPTGGGRQQEEPIADQLLINRARENARPVRPRELQVVSQVTEMGYQLAAFVPAVALGGYDPEQQPRLGFTYALFDRELGMQTFATGPPFPFDEDPSCWATIELMP